MEGAGVIFILYRTTGNDTVKEAGRFTTLTAAKRAAKNVKRWWQVNDHEWLQDESKADDAFRATRHGIERV